MNELQYDLTIDELTYHADCDQCGLSDSASIYDMDASGETIHLCGECAEVIE
jgi:hypothetical protein